MCVVNKRHKTNRTENDSYRLFAANGPFVVGFGCGDGDDRWIDGAERAETMQLCGEAARRQVSVALAVVKRPRHGGAVRVVVVYFEDNAVQRAIAHVPIHESWVLARRVVVVGYQRLSILTYVIGQNVGVEK